MKIILVAAISEDGFIADSNGKVKTWTSKEDQKFFEDIKSRYTLMVMGSRTYNLSPKKPTAGVLRVVLTREPEVYKSQVIEGQLAFHNMSPTAFAAAYKNYDACLLLGGGLVYEAFLDAGLVDEMYLTKEPAILGEGTPFLPNKSLNLSRWRSVSKKKLNEDGTTLTHYILKK